jgi:hypothetical protein
MTRPLDRNTRKALAERVWGFERMPLTDVQYFWFRVRQLFRWLDMARS